MKISKNAMDLHRRQPAFTLIELLVVIAIIALLVSILLPSLSRAKDLARNVQCLSNLRSMAMAANLYAEHYNESLPISWYRDSTTGDYYYWDFSTIGGEIKPGILWMGQHVEEIHQCPSFDGSSSTPSDPYTGYNYNVSYIGGGQNEAIEAPVKISAVKTPSQCAMFGDGQWSGGANKYMRSPIKSPGERGDFFGRFAGTQGFRHLGKTNIAFCDGHAVTLADRHTAGVANVAEGTGFISEDNSLYDLE